MAATTSSPVWGWGLSSLCWAVTLEQVVFPSKIQANSMTVETVWGCCVGDLIVIFSCHTVPQSLDTAPCALCVPLNYFNSNVCVFELFRFAESWIIMSSYLLHLEMLKALFSPCHVAHELHMPQRDIPIVSCVVWRFILITSFILGSWESFVKAIPSICSAQMWLLAAKHWSNYGYSALLIWVSVFAYWLLRLPAHCRTFKISWKKGSYFQFNPAESSPLFKKTGYSSISNATGNTYSPVNFLIISSPLF